MPAMNHIHFTGRGLGWGKGAIPVGSQQSAIGSHQSAIRNQKSEIKSNFDRSPDRDFARCI
jgi:hypothetical protein